MSHMMVCSFVTIMHMCVLLCTYVRLFVECKPPCLIKPCCVVLVWFIQFRETQQIGDEDLDPTQQPEKLRAFATMPIGKIEAFDETNNDCNAYVERIEQYFIANEIKDNKQVAVMLSLMGNKTYGLLRNLAAPAKARLALKEGSQPKFCKARRVPYAMKPKAEVELKRLEKKGILPKVKFSDWATPIVPVAKSNGTVRICGDQKTTVNPQLQTEEYPLPRIDDIFAKLTGGQKFTKIDLRQAYHQMEVEEESQEYLTINTHQGLYRYNRLVFGITSAPAIWQRSMDQILEGVEGTSCILDDMIITGKDDKEHLENLEEVLKRLQANGLRTNRE